MKRLGWSHDRKRFEFYHGLRKFRRVNPSTFKARRATMDDIPSLGDLWKTMAYDSESLARKLTEFQVVEDADGNFVGAAAMEILERHGRIHSEGFVDFSWADYARPLLWERFQSLAERSGLASLWTQEQAPFWTRCGMASPTPEALIALPADWKKLQGRWLTYKLRDIDAITAADKQFAVFMQQEKARTARTLQHARALKVMAVLMAVALLGGVIALAFYLFQNKQIFQFNR